MAISEARAAWTELKFSSVAPTCAAAASMLRRRFPKRSASQEALSAAEEDEPPLQFEPPPSFDVLLPLADAAPRRVGKSKAISASRRDRASRMRAEADAMSGLFPRASEMMRLRPGSSKRFHQRERSRAGEATGNPAAFFQSAGMEGSPRIETERTPQPLNPMKTKLESRTRRRQFMDGLVTLCGLEVSART